MIALYYNNNIYNQDNNSLVIWLLFNQAIIINFKAQNLMLEPPNEGYNILDDKLYTYTYRTSKTLC